MFLIGGQVDASPPRVLASALDAALALDARRSSAASPSARAAQAPPKTPRFPANTGIVDKLTGDPSHKVPGAAQAAITIPAMGLPSITLTRVSAVLSLVALALATVSDFVFTGFWDRNAMATSVIADVLVLVVGVAVVNEFLSARARREWRLLADYGLVELGEAARHTWVMLAQHIGVGKRESLTLREFRELVHSSQGEVTVHELALAAASDDSRHGSLHELVAELAETARARLGRWAPVLRETPFPHAVTRFVRLQARLTRLQTVLWEDSLNWQPSYEGSGDAGWIADRITNIVQLGSALELELLEMVEHPDRWGWGPHARREEPADG